MFESGLKGIEMFLPNVNVEVALLVHSRGAERALELRLLPALESFVKSQARLGPVPPPALRTVELRESGVLCLPLREEPLGGITYTTRYLQSVDIRRCDEKF
jgi:hypothetical protein